LFVFNYIEDRIWSYSDPSFLSFFLCQLIKDY